MLWKKYNPKKAIFNLKFFVKLKFTENINFLTHIK